MSRPSTSSSPQTIKFYQILPHIFTLPNSNAGEQLALGNSLARYAQKEDAGFTVEVVNHGAAPRYGTEVIITNKKTGSLVMTLKDFNEFNNEFSPFHDEQLESLIHVFERSALKNTDGTLAQAKPESDRLIERFYRGDIKETFEVDETGALIAFDESKHDIVSNVLTYHETEPGEQFKFGLAAKYFNKAHPNHHLEVSYSGDDTRIEVFDIKDGEMVPTQSEGLNGILMGYRNSVEKATNFVDARIAKEAAKQVSQEHQVDIMLKGRQPFIDTDPIEGKRVFLDYEERIQTLKKNFENGDLENGGRFIIGSDGNIEHDNTPPYSPPSGMSWGKKILIAAVSIAAISTIVYGVSKWWSNRKEAKRKKQEELKLLERERKQKEGQEIKQKKIEADRIKSKEVSTFIKEFKNFEFRYLCRTQMYEGIQQALKENYTNHKTLEERQRIKQNLMQQSIYIESLLKEVENFIAKANENINLQKNRALKKAEAPLKLNKWREEFESLKKSSVNLETRYEAPESQPQQSLAQQKSKRRRDSKSNTGKVGKLGKKSQSISSTKNTVPPTDSSVNREVERLVATGNGGKRGKASRTVSAAPSAKASAGSSRVGYGVAVDNDSGTGFSFKEEDFPLLPGVDGSGSSSADDLEIVSSASSSSSSSSNPIGTSKIKDIARRLQSFDVKSYYQEMVRKEFSENIGGGRQAILYRKLEEDIYEYYSVIVTGIDQDYGQYVRDAIGCEEVSGRFVYQHRELVSGIPAAIHSLAPNSISKDDEKILRKNYEATIAISRSQPDKVLITDLSLYFSDLNVGEFIIFPIDYAFRRVEGAKPVVYTYTEFTNAVNIEMQKQEEKRPTTSPSSRRDSSVALSKKSDSAAR